MDRLCLLVILQVHFPTFVTSMAPRCALDVHGALPAHLCAYGYQWPFFLRLTSSPQVRGHFELIQPLLEVRGKLLELLQRVDRLPAHFFELAQTARKSGHLSAGAGAIHHLKTVAARLAAEPERTGTELEPGLLVAGRTEEAKILWAQGQREMAVNLATYLAGRAEQGPERAPLLTLAGKWHAETRSASSRVILDDYLLEAAGLYAQPGPKGPGWKERRARTYFRCAHYADTLYRYASIHSFPAILLNCCFFMTVTDKRFKVE